MSYQPMTNAGQYRLGLLNVMATDAPKVALTLLGVIAEVDGAPADRVDYLRGLLERKAQGEPVPAVDIYAALEGLR